MHKRSATFLHRRSAILVGNLAIVAAALPAAWGGLASAAATPAAGKVHVYQADSRAGNRGTVILTGAITDHGTDHEGVAGGGNFNKIDLSKGSFEVNVGALVKKLDSIPVDPSTCASAGSVSGPMSIVKGSGTGAYRGIRGTFKTTATSAGILPLKDGKCDTSATRYPTVFMVNASGPVSYK